MPKVLSKKFVLVSIEDDANSRQTLRRLRRYLSSHKMKYVSSSTATEMKEHLDKLQNNCLVFQENVDTEEEIDYIPNAGEPIITTTATSTHQEALEQWAREVFPEGSEEMQLLLGASTIGQEESTQEIIDHESKDNIMNIPQLFTLNSAEADDGLEKDDGQDMATCSICECPVGIGRNRNTRIKRQAQHVIDNHSEDGFRGVQISKRYQCLQCYRTLPVSKSPCEHISEHHGRNNTDTEFLDLWNKKQLSSFNIVLEKCFNRVLPVPRSRRFRGENAEEPILKSSYRIVQGDEVVQIKTVIEKPHQAEKIASIGQITEVLQGASKSTIEKNCQPNHNDIDSQFCETSPNVFGDHCYSGQPIADEASLHQL